MTERPLPQPGIKEQRERTIQLLCQHYAQDRLELPDFEARLDIAHRAVTSAELDGLLTDLPAPAAAVSTQTAATTMRERPRGTRTMLAFMGGVERRGQWRPGRRNFVIAVMGGAELDFRDVVLPPGETEVFLFCMMGGAEIIVPPDLAVEADGIAIAGGFAHTSPRAALSPDAPMLRIQGLCVMGGAEVTIRLPGETAKDAQRRQREEKRRLRGDRE